MSRGLRIAFLLSLLPAACQLEGAITQLMAGPRVEISEADLGVVLSHSLVNATIRVTNRGDRDLVIKNIHPACGCTVMDSSVIGRVVRPRESLSIGFSLKTEGMYGPFEKHIDFETNDPERPTASGEVKGVALPPVEVKEGFVLLEGMSPGETREILVPVKYHFKGLPSMARLETGATWLSAEWVERSDEKQEGVFRMKIAGPRFPPGASRGEGTLKFHTGLAVMPLVTVQVAWTLPAVFTAEPATPVARVKQGQLTPLLLTVKAARPFEVLGVQADSGDFTASATAPGPGLAHTLRVSPTRPLPAGRYYQTLSVTTNHPESPVFKQAFFYVVE